MKEQRLFHRLLLDTEIEHRHSDADQPFRGKTKDISIGGICITTEDEPLVMGDVYMLKFALPGMEDAIEVSGKVVWTKKYAAGIAALFDNGIVFMNPDKIFVDMITDFSIGAVREE